MANIYAKITEQKKKNAFSSFKVQGFLSLFDLKN